MDLPRTPDTSGRLIVVGDVHGCDVALDVLLGELGPTAEDTLVLLGDVVDRGPNSRRVIDRLLDVQRSSRLVFLLGNHEEMMLDVLDGRDGPGGWLAVGGRETLESYGGTLAAIPDEHVEFLRGGLPLWTTETEIFVHANLEPGVPLEEQSSDWLRWRKLTSQEFPHPSGKRVICGHTGMKSGLPAVLDGWVCLDTLAYRGLYLTALDMGTEEIHQAQQSGTYRCGVTLGDLV